MFQVLLYDQWKSVRLPLALACIAGFVLPVLSVRTAYAGYAPGWQATTVLTEQALWGTVYPLLAAALGLLLGVTAWTRDHRGSHVYALSLPVPRWTYAAVKFAAGSALLLPVVSMLCAGTIVAASLATVPPGLSTYPIALTIRFGLTSLMAFSVFFAISSGTSRTAGIVLGTVALLVATGVLLMALGLDAALSIRDLIGLEGGPFESFGGRWMLIDV